MNAVVRKLCRPFQLKSWKRSVFSVPLYCGRGRSAGEQVASARLERAAKPPHSSGPSTACQAGRVPSASYCESATSMGDTPLSAASDAQIIACPRCVAQLTFVRTYPSHIDACGFESYHLDCPTCDARLECFIDPIDEEPLLSQTAT